jgi:hypothetical protein
MAGSGEVVTYRQLDDRSNPTRARVRDEQHHPHRG